MDLPAEVMQVSMRVNQRYFALRTGGWQPPRRIFAFAANVAAHGWRSPPSSPATSACCAPASADARHFWDLDRTGGCGWTSRVAALDSITFHAKLGTPG